MIDSDPAPLDQPPSESIPPIEDLPHPPEPTLQLEGVTFGNRAIVYLVDTGILFFFARAITPVYLELRSAINSILESKFHLVFGFSPLSTIFTYSVGFGVSLLFFALFEWIFAGTPAKRLFGFYVMQQDGSPCRLSSALLRGFFRLFDSLFFALIAYSTMKPPLYQRYGDKVAKTVVVKTTPLRPSSRPGLRRLLLAGSLFFILSLCFQLGMNYVRIIRIDTPVTAATAAINMKASELGDFYRLTKDENTGRCYCNGLDVREINMRRFVAPGMWVSSNVYRIPYLPANSDESLIVASLKNNLHYVFRESKYQFGPLSQAGVGEKSWFIPFRDTSTGQTGVGMIFARKNIIAQIMVYGDETFAVPEQAELFLRIIDQRITSGKYLPVQEVPAL
jgi:uncharacterized RDD family membrane protein YckC